jgi:hypothetical protein
MVIVNELNVIDTKKGKINAIWRSITADNECTWNESVIIRTVPVSLQYSMNVTLRLSNYYRCRSADNKVNVIIFNLSFFKISIKYRNKDHKD